MKKSSYILAWAFVYFLSGSFAQAIGGEKLSLRDSTIYPILKKNSAVECRMEKNTGFGFILKRGPGDEVKINMITSNVVEGDATMVVAQKIQENANGIFVQYKKPRSGSDDLYGYYLEFTILKKRTANIKFQFPGMVAQTSIIYKKDAKGNDDEELFGEYLINLECKMI